LIYEPSCFSLRLQTKFQLLTSEHSRARSGPPNKQLPGCLLRRSVKIDTGKGWRCLLFSCPRLFWLWRGWPDSTAVGVCSGLVALCRGSLEPWQAGCWCCHELRHNAFSSSTARLRKLLSAGAAQLAACALFSPGCAACGSTTPIEPSRSWRNHSSFPARSAWESFSLWFKGVLGESAYGVVSVVSHLLVAGRSI